MLSEDKALENIAKGSTRAVIDYSEDKIKELALKFLDRRVAFVKDKKTIEIAKEQSRNNEFNFFKKYVKNEKFNILFRLGLTLRYLDKEDKNKDSLRNLKQKIRSKYDLDGLHIAYFVQNQLFPKYVANLLENNIDIKDLNKSISYLFTNIRKIVYFINSSDNIRNKTREIVNTIDVEKSYCFIISALGSAIDIARSITKKVEKSINNYNLESTISKNRVVYFFNICDSNLNNFDLLNY